MVNHEAPVEPHLNHDGVSGLVRDELRAGLADGHPGCQDRPAGGEVENSLVHGVEAIATLATRPGKHTKKAMEHVKIGPKWPQIRVDLPMKNGDFPELCVLVYTSG